MDKKEANDKEFLRRHRIIYQAIHTHLNPEQIKSILDLWENEFSDENTFKVFGFYRRICEDISLSQEVAIVINSNLVYAIDAKLDTLPETPLEHLLKPGKINFYQEVKSKIGEHIGFKNAEKIMERQLLRSNLSVLELKIEHIPLILSSLRASLLLYSKEQSIIEVILSNIEELGTPDNLYDKTTFILQQAVGGKAAKEMVEQQLTRLDIDEVEFSKVHLKKSLISFRATISKYCDNLGQVKKIMQHLSRLANY